MAAKKKPLDVKTPPPGSCGRDAREPRRRGSRWSCRRPRPAGEDPAGRPGRGRARAGAPAARRSEGDLMAATSSSSPSGASGELKRPSLEAVVDGAAPGRRRRTRSSRSRSDRGAAAAAAAVGAHGADRVLARRRTPRCDALRARDLRGGARRRRPRHSGSRRDRRCAGNEPGRDVAARAAARLDDRRACRDVVELERRRRRRAARQAARLLGQGVRLGVASPTRARRWRPCGRTSSRRSADGRAAAAAVVAFAPALPAPRARRDRAPRARRRRRSSTSPRRRSSSRGGRGLKAPEHFSLDPRPRARRSAGRSARRARWSTPAGSLTPTRSARPARSSRPSSTSRAGSRARSSTSPGCPRRR